jgi:SAM-dependent methyltransferase
MARSIAMQQNFPHSMSPQPNLDEQALQDFVATLRKHLATRVAAGLPAVYERQVLPAFRAEYQREPADRHEVRRAMTQNGYHQFWSALQRRSQELMWDTVIDTVERQLPALIARAGAEAPAQGSLQLDPDLQIPRYHTALDIHLQPGGYHTDFAADDVAAGAIYDAALPIYLAGALGTHNDLLGRLLLGYLREQWPAFRPTRILDMGCAIGNSTVPWARGFPEAEMHAIDVGAPVLRYAHARAAALGAPIHFSQRNAEQTGFPDESFDLIVSHIMLHETSSKALPRILAECHRLLRPGGLMLHMEIPRGNTAFEQFMYEWETYNNNETFSGYLTGLDLAQLATRAGFASDECRVEAARLGMQAEQRNYGQQEFAWPILVGEKRTQTSSRRSA